MSLVVRRFVFVSALFIAWLCYLGFLVATRPQTSGGWPLVVSRPQILVSGTDVVAELPDPPGKEFVEVVVKEVLFPDDSKLKPGDKIKVSNLGECQPLPRGSDQPVPPDWSKAGRYLLPLTAIKGQPGHYEITAIPSSPGFNLRGVVRIYPAIQETLDQYSSIKKPPRN
jgi:hypothetical protein